MDGHWQKLTINDIAENIIQSAGPCKQITMLQDAKIYLNHAVVTVEVMLFSDILKWRRQINKLAENSMDQHKYYNSQRENSIWEHRGCALAEKSWCVCFLVSLSAWPAMKEERRILHCTGNPSQARPWQANDWGNEQARNMTKRRSKLKWAQTLGTHTLFVPIRCQ